MQRRGSVLPGSLSHCTQTLHQIHDAPDARSVKLLVGILQDWSDGMAKNKTRKEGTSFWKSSSERETLPQLFQTYLAKKPCKDIVQKKVVVGHVPDVDVVVSKEPDFDQILNVDLEDSVEPQTLKSQGSLQEAGSSPGELSSIPKAKKSLSNKGKVKVMRRKPFPSTREDKANEPHPSGNSSVP